jgi:hypothetical protein
MAYPYPELEAAFEADGPLAGLLEDGAVEVIHLSHQGRLTYQRQGAWCEGERVDEGAAEALSRGFAGIEGFEPGPVFVNDWVVERFAAANGMTYVFERRCRGDVAGLPRGLIVTLEQELERGACGLVLGGPASGAEQVLMHLGLTSASRPVAWVGPVAVSGEAEQALCPFAWPQSRAEGPRLARQLARFPVAIAVESPPSEELAILFAHDGARRRWAGIVTEDVHQTLRRLSGAREAGLPLHLDVVVVMGPRKASGISVAHLMRRNDGQWQEMVHADQGLLYALESGFSDEDVDAPESVARTPAAAAAADRKRISEEFDIETLIAAEANREKDVREVWTTANLLGVHDEEPPTGEFVLDADDLEVRETGVSDLATTNVVRGDRLEQILPVIEAHRDIADLQIGQVAPDQLRQTIESEVNVRALRRELMNAVQRERERTVVEPPPRPEPAPVLEEKTAEIDIPKAWQDLSRKTTRKDS